MIKRMRLYHGTPYPSGEGLQPRLNRTCVHAEFAMHGDEAVRCRSLEHEDRFVFATADRSYALCYAFKTDNKPYRDGRRVMSDAKAFAQGTHGIHFSNAHGDGRLPVFLIGEPCAYRDALAQAQPTLFEIRDVKSFQPVCTVEGIPTNEWITRAAVTLGAAKTSPANWDDLAKLEPQFYAYDHPGNVKYLPVHADWLLPMLLGNKQVRPVNVALGLPPNRPARVAGAGLAQLAASCG